jgi:hypothetical protein
MLIFSSCRTMMWMHAGNSGSNSNRNVVPRCIARLVSSLLNYQPTMNMKKKKKLTLEEHQKIAAWLTDPIVLRMACDIPNTYGKTSRAGRFARKMSDAVMHLRSEMENMAYTDGHSDVATDLYYPANV